MSYTILSTGVKIDRNNKTTIFIPMEFFRKCDYMEVSKPYAMGGEGFHSVIFCYIAASGKREIYTPLSVFEAEEMLTKIFS